MNALWPLWASAIFLLLLVLAGLLWPLLNGPAEQPVPNADAHERLRRLYRTQREELDREHQRRTLDAQDYAQAIEELERRLLEDLDVSPIPPISAPYGSWRRRLPAALLSVLLPVGAVVLYLQQGDPRAAATLALAAPDTHAGAGADVKAMVSRLEERLRQQPADLEGWIVLARSREALEEFGAATAAYQSALELAKQQQLPSAFQARLHADLADAMASARDGALDAPVQDVLKAALQLDPDQPKALALAGTATLREGDRAGALRHWQRLLGLLEPDSDIALRVQNDLAGLEPGNKKPQAPASNPGNPTPVAGLAGTVRLDPALHDRVNAADTVFIVARSPAAGRMPLAVRRFTATQLPIDFTLDDRDAMSSDMPLSRFDELTIEARISRSGQAQRQPGQPVSLPQAVHRGSAGLVLTIGEIEP
jgi:cytochrome c-type biogenesis protein CcmH